MNGARAIRAALTRLGTTDRARIYRTRATAPQCSAGTVDSTVFCGAIRPRLVMMAVRMTMLRRVRIGDLPPRRILHLKGEPRNHVSQPRSILQIREHQRPAPAHLARVAIHHLERRSDMGSEIDFV